MRTWRRRKAPRSGFPFLADPVLDGVEPPPAALGAAPSRGRQLRVVAPDDIGLEVLYAVEQEGPAIGPGKLRDPLQPLDRIKPPRPPEEVEVEAGLWIQGREEALPAVDNPVELLGCPPVEDRRGEASNGEELTRAGDAARERQTLADPAPIRQLVGKGPGRVMIATLLRDIHSMISRCHAGTLPPS